MTSDVSSSALHHGNAGLEHGAHIVGQAREIELSIEDADIRHMELQPVKSDLAGRSADVAEDEPASHDDDGEEDEAVADEKIADAEYDLGIDRYGHARIGDDAGDLWYDHSEHEDHDGDEGHDDESRIDESAFCF